MTPHNITQVAVEHTPDGPKRPTASVITGSHNIYFRIGSRHVTPVLMLGRRTDVRIANLPQQRLRQQMVKPALWRGQPFYPRHTPPSSFERRLILDVAEVQRAAITEADTRPHVGMVAL